MDKRNIDNEMQHLRELKEVLSEEQYKYSAATIYTTYFIELFKKKHKKFNRQDVVDKVNIMLARDGLGEVSYNFFRKYDLTNFK